MPGLFDDQYGLTDFYDQERGQVNKNAPGGSTPGMIGATDENGAHAVPHGMGHMYAPQPGGVDPHSVYYNDGRFNEWRDAIGANQQRRDQVQQDWQDRFARDFRNQMLGQARQGMLNMQSESMARGANMGALRGATMAGNEMMGGTRMDIETVRRAQEEQSRLQDFLSHKEGMGDIGRFWDAWAGGRNEQDQYQREMAAARVEEQRRRNEEQRQKENAVVSGMFAGVPVVGGFANMINLR